jgi:hypothetical protein
MMCLCWVVRGVCWWPRLDHLDRPPVIARRQPQTDVDHLQQVPGEDSARGRMCGYGLRDEEPWAVRGERSLASKHALEEERGLFIRDILIEEGGQWLEEDEQADGMSGK